MSTPGYIREEDEHLYPQRKCPKTGRLLGYIPDPEPEPETPVEKPRLRVKTDGTP